MLFVIDIKEQSLEKWLSHIETLHAKAIDLGLERMRTMIGRMKIKFDCPVIIVGGTNGKGTTCSCLERILLAQGYKTAVHTSPHLIKFNERARLNGGHVDDASLVEHFRRVEELREEISLSYFEYTLLGILSLFQEAKPDAVILEVGLGGRLDAVNTVEPDASIVTTVGIDHVAYLGDTREKIGWEKAHIYRPGKPAVCADPNPPSTLVDFAEEIGAELILAGKGYVFDHHPGSESWSYEFGDFSFKDLPLPGAEGEHMVRNAAGALTVLLSITDKLPVSEESIRKGICQMGATGRFQKVRENPEIILDVGHNPHAALELKKTLDAHPCKGRKVIVLGMLKDKDREEVCRILSGSFDKWHLADLDGPRGGKAEDLRNFLVSCGVNPKDISTYGNVVNALSASQLESKPADTILVSGSFLTVAAAAEFLQLPVL